jgi:hypothetical protein
MHCAIHTGGVLCAIYLSDLARTCHTQSQRKMAALARDLTSSCRRARPGWHARGCHHDGNCVLLRGGGHLDARRVRQQPTHPRRDHDAALCAGVDEVQLALVLRFPEGRCRGQALSHTQTAYHFPQAHNLPKVVEA